MIDEQIIEVKDGRQFVEFNAKNLQDKAIIIAIVGDKKRIDLEELKKFGKIIEIKEDDLFKD